MALTDTRVRQAKPQGGAYKLADAGGLYLYVAPSGAKSWRYDYRFAGRRETLTLGRYPELSLALARGQHGDARKVLARGESPALAKKRARQAAVLSVANTVKAIAEAWYAETALHRSAVWRDAVRRWLDQRIAPALGSRAIADVEPADVLALTRQIAQKHPKTAECVRQTLSRVFEYAIRNLRARHNPAREVRGAIVVPPATHHRKLSAKEIPGFLEKVDAYPGRLATKLAVKLLLLTLVRKRELLNATWEEIDVKAAEWRIPAERMKMSRPHIVPLSKQSLKVFEELKALACGSIYVFPNIGVLSKPMSASTLNAAFERMGLEGFSPHGLRGTAATLLREKGFSSDLVERQLAHVERNRVKAAYDHSELLPERRRMLKAWSDYIDRLCAGGSVTPIKEKKAAR